MRSKKIILVLVVIVTALFSIILAQNTVKKVDSSENKIEVQQNRLAQAANEGINAGEDEKVAQQIRQQIRQLRERKNLYELVNLAEEVEAKYANKDVRQYASLMLEICGALSSYNFDNNNQQYFYVERFTKKVLEKSPLLLPKEELDFVNFLTADLIEQTGNGSEKEWVRNRTVTTKLWLNAWKKLEDSIDKDFNFEANRPIYRKNMTAEEGKRAKKYNEQRFLERDEKTFLPALQRYLIEAYAKNPPDPLELQKLLNKYISDESLKQNILLEVERRITENEKLKLENNQPNQ